MGYTFHITRAEDRLESESNPISLEDWLTLVRQDPEMRMDGHAEAVTPDGVLRVESPGLAVWIAYSKHLVNGNMAWFDHDNGEIIVKNADDEVRGKMKEIAAQLAAKVVGDDGEVY